jgi:ABC-type uncharacterized transport system involved in gliding motility auxiliary subunit
MNMLKNVASFGPVLIILAYVWYSIQGVWDLRVQIAFYGGLVLTLAMIRLSFGQIKASFRRRSTQYGTNTVVMVLMVVGLLAMVNFLAKKYQERWDLTSAKLYSLSDQTEKLVTGLKAEVEIIHFDKEPNPVLDDLMKEYVALNPSALSYRRVDPQAEPGLARKFEVNRFGDIVVVSGEKRESVESAQEEEITNTILKVTREQDKVIYFTKGHNEADVENSQEERGYAAAKQAIENQNYRVESINLAEAGSIPDDCSALVIAGPAVALLPTETALIDRYVDAGGKVLLLLDPDLDSGMEELLEKWKIGVEDDIVVDSSGLGQLFGMGPAAPLVTSYESHPITEDLNNTMTFFPEARSLKTVDHEDSSFSSRALLRTSERSWGEKNLVEGAAEFNQGEDIEGPVVLGVVSTLAVSSAAGDSNGAQEENGGEDSGREEAEKDRSFGKEARVVVIGDSDFANNAFLRHQRNGDLFLNAVSWLAEDEDLISVRPKNSENRSVQMTPAHSRILFWVTMVALPGAALGLGLLVWSRRRKA